jgi:NAD(P)H-hydrate epimerase
VDIAKEIRKKWKPRSHHAHKGDFGRVLIVAGSKGYAGAAHLAAAACVRAGAGLVTLAVPEKIYPVLARREAEVMVKPFPSTRDGSFSMRALKPILNFVKGQDVVAVGPGLSQNPETQRLIRRLIPKIQIPLVIDADGLNALRGHAGVLRQCRKQTILTPHPGEFVRLFGGTLTAETSVRRKRAVEVAKLYGIIMLLKGCRTVVASSDGQVAMNTTGNPGMATGGTGDILTGIIAALIGQKFSLWNSVRFAAYLHGLAGDLAAKKFGEVSLKASDLLDFLSQALQKTLRH